MNELEKLLDIFTAVMSAVKDFISQIIKTTYLEIIIKIIKSISLKLLSTK